MLRWRSLLISLALLTAGTAPAAHAASVTLSESRSSPGPHGSIDTYDTLHVVAGPGERNDITIATEGPAAAVVAFVVSDAGSASPVAGPGCTAQDDGGVRCALTAGAVVGSSTVDAGDGDDVVSIAGGTSWIVDGGTGDDRLSFSGGAAGGALHGGDGADVLTGGDGNDALDGGSGADRMSGGAGEDQVTYADRTAPITATIDASGNGEAGEDDAIAGDVEDLDGGRGDDRLTGDDRANRLAGGDGADTLDGRGGDDHLVAGPWYAAGTAAQDVSTLTADQLFGGDGDDELLLAGDGAGYGGPGADHLVTQAGGLLAGGPGRDLYDVDVQRRGRALVAAADDGYADLVQCSAGPPALVGLGPGDVSLGCGTAVARSGSRPGALAALPRAALLPYGPGIIWTRVACADDARGGCGVRATIVDERGRPVGHGQTRHRVRPGALGEIRVIFTKAYTKRLQRQHAITATYLASMRDAHGAVRTDRVGFCVTADPFVTETCP